MEYVIHNEIFREYGIDHIISHISRTLYYLMPMKSLFILAIIACVVGFIITKVLKKDGGEKSLCPACGKPYGGKPAKCPHCGEQLRWKQG